MSDNIVEITQSDSISKDSSPKNEIILGRKIINEIILFILI